MAQLFANAARSVLTSSITNSAMALQIDPADQQFFPVAAGSDYFKVALQDQTGNIEYVKVQRAVGQSILTVTTGGRAVEDSANFPARAFNAGALVELRMTAADLVATIGHPSQASNAHQASAIGFTAGGGIASSNVQDALAELDTEKLSVSGGTVNGSVQVTGNIQARASGSVGGANVYSGDATYSGSIAFLNPAGVQIGILGLGDGTKLSIQTVGTRFWEFNVPPQSTADATSANELVRKSQVDKYSPVPGDFKLAAYSSLPAGFTSRNQVLITTGLCLDITGIYANLAYLYCGNAKNSTADFYFRCTDPANPNTTRSTTGQYLRMPEPGYFIRVLNNGGSGLNSGRDPYKYEDQDIQPHSHPTTASGSGAGSGGYPDPLSIVYNSGSSTGSAGGAETRPKNWGAYVWMWY
ncbi:MAG: hypothetical protein QM762_08775 [Chryseolinea sp.]